MAVANLLARVLKLVGFLIVLADTDELALEEPAAELAFGAQGGTCTHPLTR